VTNRSVMIYGCPPMGDELPSQNPDCTAPGFTISPTFPAAPRTVEIQKAVSAIFTAIEGLTEEETKRAIDAVAVAMGVRK
jgi:hypothetical protein